MKFSSFFKVLLWMLLVSLCIPALYAQDDATGWALVREDDGIKIFTRPNSDPKNPIDEVKGEVTFVGNIDSAFAIISDISKFASTDEVVSSTEKLSRQDERYCYYYQTGKTPFFMKDWDAVFRLSSTKTSQGYFTCMEAIEDTVLVPLSKDYQRINGLIVYVSLQQNPDNKSFKLSYKSNYKFAEGAAGSLKVNIYNKLSITSIYNRLVNLRKLISDETKTTAKQ